MKVPPDKPRAKLFDLEVPFFLPMYRRVLAVVVPILWALFEFSNSAYFWGLIFMGLGGIAAWRFMNADWEAVAAQAEEDAKGGK
ncbi:hypothetical protein MWU60_02715 [Yoonia sp. F2084L]|uniref:hypothetical protein n=1 Tax=Yoonia sp. F2084L TaxID=2926419 RepID=UPI001FF39148|nr:hypothetical protein [Yoonia sp. F2084L]MCK0094471.1 hypothetical protein [Yoonia sp. F2084L]